MFVKILHEALTQQKNINPNYHHRSAVASDFTGTPCSGPQETMRTDSKGRNVGVKEKHLTNFSWMEEVKAKPLLSAVSSEAAGVSFLTYQLQ